VDSIKYISEMPYIGCGDKIFWRIVEQKQEIIPLLLEKMVDTTQAEVSVPNFGGQYTVADIAYNALEEIIKDIPTFDLLGTLTAVDIAHIGITYERTLRIGKNYKNKFELGMKK
jgi:hypothetical protein